jgi:Zn finger protein HypA/HybF involved in hydrogenase expression
MMKEYTCEVHDCQHKFEATPDRRMFGDIEAPVVNCPECGNMMQVGEGKNFGPRTYAEIFPETQEPDYWCEGCWEFATNNPDDMSWFEDEYWICPLCGHKNHL